MSEERVADVDVAGRARRWHHVVDGDRLVNGRSNSVAGDPIRFVVRQKTGDLAMASSGEQRWPVVGPDVVPQEDRREHLLPGPDVVVNQSPSMCQTGWMDPGRRQGNPQLAARCHCPAPASASNAVRTASVTASTRIGMS